MPLTGVCVGVCVCGPRIDSHKRFAIAEMTFKVTIRSLLLALFEISHESLFAFQSNCPHLVFLANNLLLIDS